MAGQESERNENKKSTGGFLAASIYGRGVGKDDFSMKGTGRKKT